VERFLVVHGQIILNQFKQYPVKSIQRAAVLGELRAAMEQRNIAKAQLLYDFLDSSSLFENRVAKDCRSRMNVPFFLRDESRNDAFLAGAKAANLLQLKGHKSVGGMRASIYNAMPIEGVQALVAYMREFEKTQA
jgi:phosphoserine aminotransferase